MYNDKKLLNIKRTSLKVNGMNYVITIDFGSTFTKIVVVSLAEKKIILSDKVASTVGIDATICLNQCYELARTVLSEEEFQNAKKLASSSAAGGLRMAVIGLTKSLSTLAGKAAALGAGAKIIANYSGRLTDEKMQRLEESNAEIILLCGGYERGNVSMVLANANKIAGSKVKVPIIYSGNSELCHDIRCIMQSNHKKCYVVENIIPELNVLNVEPAQEVIRNLFLDRITDMKGFNVVKQEFDNQLIPTPKAVLTAGMLLNKGTENIEGFGPLLIVDIGGATTDVYSFDENRSFGGARPVGLAEPFAKRTVEGDLGMRESSGGVINENYINEVIKDLGIEEEQLRKSIGNRIRNIDYLPDCEMERKIDDTIAKLAVYQALRRHAGCVKPSYNAKCQSIQVGKNITEVSKVIGTGGILVHNRNPIKIMKSAEKNYRDKGILLPEKIDGYLDTEYVLFSAGLLKEIDQDAAIEIMLKSIKQCQ